MAANQLTNEDVYTLRPGDELIIPVAGASVPIATARPVLPPTPTTPPRTYTIRSGDTPIAIANLFGISVDVLLAANGLSREDARRLRTGQVLVIPGSGQAINAPPNVVNPIAPLTGPAAIRLDAPQLRSPENAAQVSCTQGNTLAWEPVSFIRASDQYLMHLGFVNGLSADGRETVVWVLEQIQSSSNTIWQMDPSLCGLAPQEFGRKWYWYVEVIELANGARVRISPPSQSWSFSWR